MKTKKNELEIDFIDGQKGLTLVEESALAVYFAKSKSSKVKRNKGKGKDKAAQKKISSDKLTN